MEEEIVEISVGVFAHNEEQNIERALRSVLHSQLETVVLKEILVISSGSFDRTNRLVRQFAKKDKRIKLIDEVVRRGKSAAINTFITNASADVLVTMSADLKLSKQALEEIGTVFLNKEVGMAGAHPIPLFTRFSQIGEEIKLLWELHHEVSLISPKCGELVAFRNVIKAIPSESAVDEATIEVLLRLLGYHVVYAPLSIVYNRGPRTIGEFFVQRRRVEAGHLWVQQKYNYQVSTMVFDQVARVILVKMLREPRKIVPMVRLIGLEIGARILGWVDFHVFGRNPFVWTMIRR